jgi:solute carrier family 25 ornithine transporter 2/15
MALYHGAVPAVVGQTCKTAVVFMSYGLCEEAIRRVSGCLSIHDMNIWHHAGSGAMTGIVASFVLCPLELVKCRLQVLKQVTEELKSSQQQKFLR